MVSVPTKAAEGQPKSGGINLLHKKRDTSEVKFTKPNKRCQYFFQHFRQF